MLENLRDDIFFIGITIGTAIGIFLVTILNGVPEQIKKILTPLGEWITSQPFFFKYRKRSHRQRPSRKSTARIGDVDVGLELYAVEAKWKGKKNES